MQFLYKTHKTINSASVPSADVHSSTTMRKNWRQTTSYRYGIAFLLPRDAMLRRRAVSVRNGNGNGNENISNAPPTV